MTSTRDNNSPAAEVIAQTAAGSTSTILAKFIPKSILKSSEGSTNSNPHHVQFSENNIKYDTTPEQRSYNQIEIIYNPDVEPKQKMTSDETQNHLEQLLHGINNTADWNIFTGRQNNSQSQDWNNELSTICFSATWECLLYNRIIALAAMHKIKLDQYTYSGQDGHIGSRRFDISYDTPNCLPENLDNFMLQVKQLLMADFQNKSVKQEEKSDSSSLLTIKL